nr:MAG TPA: hypothetical protein [Caudoviricetes sp.]
MGLFTRLFNNSQSVNIDFSFSQTSYYVENKQKTRGILPAVSSETLNGYISPSGGFVSYGRFQVIGINPNTKRKNKRIYETKDCFSARKCAANDGLVEPYDISVLPSVPPTDRQLDYAKSLDACIPNGACFLDVSAIISRITENKEELDSEKIAKQAFIYNIKFSRYHSKSAIMDIAKRSLSASDYKNFRLSIK